MKMIGLKSHFKRVWSWAHVSTETIFRLPQTPKECEPYRPAKFVGARVAWFCAKTVGSNHKHWQGLPSELARLQKPL
jgi:hypothetical protein